MLHTKIAAAAIWAADQPCFFLDRRRPMWKLVAGYAEHSGKTAKKRMRAKDTGICSIIGYGDAAPDIIVVEKDVALDLWTRCFSVAAASPAHFSTDSSVIRALNIGCRADSYEIVHSPRHSADIWSSLLLNNDVLAYGADVAAAHLLDKTRRRIRRTNRRQDIVSFADWSADLELLDDDIPEPPALRPSNWRYLRGRLAAYLYCVYAAATANAVARPVVGNAYDLGTALVTADTASLLQTAGSVQNSHFSWTTADFAAAQRLFEEMLCRPRNQGSALPQDILLDICSSEAVNAGDWKMAGNRVASYLPGNEVAIRLAEQTWGAPALLEALHSRASGRARDVCHISCVAMPGIVFAANLAASLKMPLQQRLIAALNATEYVTIQPADGETRRPTAIQLGSTVRGAFPEAKEGIDFFIVWSLAANTTFALVLPKHMWERLSIGETAKIYAAYGRKRCTLETATMVAMALQEQPVHGLAAAKMMLGYGHDSADMPLLLAERIIARVDEILRMYAPTADKLVDLIWQSLVRGAGDALWTVLETALCTTAASVHVCMAKGTRGSDVPPWIRRHEWWETFFATPEPGRYNDIWTEVLSANKRLFGRTEPVHAVPNEYTMLPAEAGATKPGALAAAGTEVFAAAAGITSTFGGNGALRTAKDTFDGQLHWHLLDCALEAVATGAAHALDARRWMRNIRIRTSPCRIRGMVRVPEDVPAPRCSVGFAGKAEGNVAALAQTQVSFRTFCRIFPGIASVFAMKRGSTLDRARQVSAHFLAETSDAALLGRGRIGNGMEMRTFPVRPGDIVGTLPECRSGLNSDEEREQSQREWFVCPLPEPFCDIPRPLADLPPGTLEVVMSNFYQL